VQAPQGRIRGILKWTVISLINVPARIRTRDLWLWYHIELHAPTSSTQKLKLIGKDGQFTYTPTLFKSIERIPNVSILVDPRELMGELVRDFTPERNSACSVHWWLMLICSERKKKPLCSWWLMLICCKRKIVLLVGSGLFADPA
jgi:hypothetical protein